MIVKSITTDVAGIGYCRVYSSQCQFLNLPKLYCCLYEVSVYVRRDNEFEYVISCSDCRAEIREALDHERAVVEQEKLKLKYGSLDNES